MIANKRVLAALAIIATVALAPIAVSAQAQNPRIALVIGNATYKDQALATTANDAGLVAQTLQAAGFDVVGARDLDQKSVQTAFRDFLDKAAAAGPDMQAFVYLAGRGLQYNGDNYFVPVDARINRDSDVPIEALRISDFAHALAQTPGKARVIVLDAARANPYASQGSPLAPGLALVDPEPGELMAFNAAPGTLAGDEQGPYGVYGKTLAGAMRQGGVGVEDVFNQVRVTVNQETQGALIPWSASKLGEPYFIFERAADAPPPLISPATEQANQPIAGLPADAAYAAALQRDTMRGYEDYLVAYPDSDQARRIRAILAARREAEFWRRSVNANTSHAYWTYLRRYPHGPHVADARRRLAMISAAYEPPPDFAPEAYADLPPPPPDEGFYSAQPYYAFDEFGPPPPAPPPDYYYSEGDDWRDLPPPPPPEGIGALPVLVIGIPLIAGAVAYQEHFHRNGIAPVGTRPPPLAPHTPPPLPANIRPAAPPPPMAAVAPKNNIGLVKPLPPIGGQQLPPGGKPVVPSQPVTGKSPTVTPGALTPLPGVPATTPGGKSPSVGTAPPGAKPPAATVIAPPPGKALPVPAAPVVTAPTTPSLGLKPAPKGPSPAIAPAAAPTQITTPKPAVNPPAASVGTAPSGAKPPAATVIAPPPGKALPVPAAPVVTAPTTPSLGLKPAPKGPSPAIAPAAAPTQITTPKPAVNPPAASVGTAPSGAKPPAATVIAPPPGKALPVPAAPVVTAPTTPSLGLKPLPKGPSPAIAPAAAPTQITTPKPAVNPPAPPAAALPAPPKALAPTTPPPQAPAFHAPPQPTVVHAPPPQAPAFHAPPPQPTIVHAPPPQAPAFHAPPPQPTVVHAPPPQAPAFHPPPPNAPIVRAPSPAAARAPPCGKPGLPQCPK